MVLIEGLHLAQLQSIGGFIGLPRGIIFENKQRMKKRRPVVKFTGALNLGQWQIGEGHVRLMVVL